MFYLYLDFNIKMCKCGVVDTVFFSILFCGLLATMGCMIYIWVQGKPSYILYNVDSQGNVCGTKNADIDLSDRPLLFLFDSFYFPHQSHSVCTNTCPEYDLKNKMEVYSYANTTKHELCLYGVSVSEYATLPGSEFDPQGRCPRLPVLKSVEYLHVCIPEVTINSAQVLGYIDLVVPIVHQCFRTVYHYWPFSVIGAMTSFFLASLVFILMLCLHKLAMAVVFPILVIAVLTGFISAWFAYHTVCKRLSDAMSSRLPLTSLEVKNEVALFVIAIVLTVILFAIVFIFLINIKTFIQEVGRLFKIFAVFVDSSKFIIWLPVVSCLAVALVLTGAIAGAFCSLGLVEIEVKQSFNPFDFYYLPSPPYVARPAKAAVSFAVILFLFWLPRIVVNSVKLVTHLSASEFLYAIGPTRKLNTLVKPSVFSLMSTAVTVSLVESVLLPISFISGLILALLTPCDQAIHGCNAVFRKITFWLSVGYAVQASVSETEISGHTTFYKAVVEGLRTIEEPFLNHSRCRALVAAEWILSCATAAIFSVAVTVLVLQMRYPDLLSLSAPSMFLVIFVCYWIAAAAMAPLSAAFTTFCLNYDIALSAIGEEFAAVKSKSDVSTAYWQNADNWERQGKA